MASDSRDPIYLRYIKRRCLASSQRPSCPSLILPHSFPQASDTDTMAGTMYRQCRVLLLSMTLMALSVLSQTVTTTDA